jgi:hypothetical protein
MQTSELTHLMLALLAGVLIGVIGTVAAYTAVGAHPGEAADREEADQALKEAQEERNEAVTQLKEYRDAEERRRRGVDLGGGDETPQRPAVAAAPRADAAPRAEAAAPRRTESAPEPRAGTAAAQPREAAPAPREQAGAAAAPAGGFGPPRRPGD